MKIAILDDWLDTARDLADWDQLDADITFVTRHIREADLPQALAGFDAAAMPTIPIVPPKISDFDDDEAFGDLNRLLLRNPSVANLLDRCAISLPVAAAGEAPVGLSLMGPAMADRRLLAIARTAEIVLGG